MQPTSRITSKGQTTIPREVRQKLSLRPGDVLVYELDEDEVRVRKQAPLDVAYLRAVQTTLSEWDSPRMRPPSTIFEQFEMPASACARPTLSNALADQPPRDIQRTAQDFAAGHECIGHGGAAAMIASA